MTTGWAHFEHEADVGLRGLGPEKAMAFAQAALALTAAVTELDTVRAETPVEIACTAPDDELLLVDWLNAVIYEMSTRHMLFSRFEVAIDGRTLTATAWGETVDRGRHRPAVEPKGATMTALHVGPKDGGWVAECVVDV